MLGTEPSSDTLIHHETDEAFTVSVGRSRSGDFIYVSAHSAVTSDGEPGNELAYEGWRRETASSCL